MDNSNKGKSLIAKMAERFGITDQNRFYDSLKQTAFNNGNNPPTDAQMMALLVVADQYGLNPWTKEIYAFPDKRGGIIPVVGVDGWSRIINTHTEFDGVLFVPSEEMITIDSRAKPCPAYIDCTLYRKDRTHPTTIREYLDEVYKPAKKFDGPWQTHTKRFLRHKAMIQCARVAFGFAGIFDPDEASRIREQQQKDMGTVEVVETPSQVVEISASEPMPMIEQEQAQVLLPPVVESDQPFVDDHVRTLTSQLTERAITHNAFQSCIDYAKQTWKGSDQQYVVTELQKAQQAAQQFAFQRN